MPFIGGRSSAAKGFFGAGSTPAAPTGLSSTPGNGQLSIAFTAPTFDGGLPITNYEYSINAGSTWTALSPADTISPITIGSLNNGTAYTVYLRAVNALGGGQSSAALSTNTTPYTLPSITLNAATNFNQNRATLNATVTSNGGSAITSVTFQYYKDADAYTDIAGVETSGGSNVWYANITSLTEAKAYTFRVKATNAAGTTTTGTSTFTTWQKIYIATQTSGNVTVPTVTPTGGSAQSRLIYEIAVLSGGGGSGYGSGGGGGQLKSFASATVNDAGGVVAYTVGGGGAHVTATTVNDGSRSESGGTSSITGTSSTLSSPGGVGAQSSAPNSGTRTEDGGASADNTNIFIGGNGVYDMSGKSALVGSGGGAGAGGGGGSGSDPGGTWYGGNAGAANSAYGLVSVGGGGCGYGNTASGSAHPTNMWGRGGNGSDPSSLGPTGEQGQAGGIAFYYYGP